MMAAVLLLIGLVLATADGYIDPQIQGAERDLMTQIMMPYPDYTGDVIFIDSEGIVHRNRLETNVRIGEPVAGKPGIFRWPGDSEEFPLSTPEGYESGPPSAPESSGNGGGGEELNWPCELVASTEPEWLQQISGPPEYAGTGPYRRVYIGPASISSTRVDGALAPDSGMHPSSKPGIGYVYMSPWSQQANFASGGDNGLQFSHLRRGWDPFCLVNGRPYSVVRTNPPGASYFMTLSAPRTVTSEGRTFQVVGFYVRAYTATQWWATIWIGELSANRQWGPNNFGVAKITSIAQNPEGNTGSFHLNHSWTDSTVVAGGVNRYWSQHPGGYALQRYPTVLNAPRWTRMPVVTAGTSPNGETVSLDCRP